MPASLITWMLFLPLCGAGCIALLAAAQAVGLDRARAANLSRAVALAIFAVGLALALALYLQLDRAAAGLQLVSRTVWIPALGVEYAVGIDGVSAMLILLTALVGLLACVASMPFGSGAVPLPEDHFTQRSVPAYFALLLLLQTGILGVFCALDLFLFYVFWEVMLLPMFFLIGIWGGARRQLAAIKFFLYTLAGSVLLLLGILWIVQHAPARLVAGRTVPNFDLISLAAFGRSGGFSRVAGGAFGFSAAQLVWGALFVGFAVKIPIVPLHTWLPDAHVEAPTPISVILAGVLLKLGVYGLIRVSFPLLPQETQAAAGFLAAVGTLSILYGALCCLAQRDFKRLIAYSSVSHMGFCLLGLSALTPQGFEGAVLNLWTHGLISPMLFLVVGVAYERTHHRELGGYGGLAQPMPEYAALLALAFFASLGLPGLCGFWAEFGVFLGSFAAHPALTGLAVLTLVLTAAYYLRALQQVLLGPVPARWAALPDLNLRERLTLYPLAALIVLFGFSPRFILEALAAPLRSLLAALS